MPTLMLLPTAVPPGYDGHDAHVVGYAPFFRENPVYGSPSIMRGSVVGPGQHQAVYGTWDFPPDPVYHNPAIKHPVVRAEAPSFPYRMDKANTAQDKRRKVYVAPTYFLNVRAPTLDEVKSFLSVQ